MRTQSIERLERKLFLAADFEVSVTDYNTIAGSLRPIDAAVDIKNSGDETTPAGVDYVVTLSIANKPDDPPYVLGKGSLPAISPGKSVHLNLSSAVPPGFENSGREWTIIVDPENKVTEIDKFNNVVINGVNLVPTIERNILKCSDQDDTITLYDDGDIIIFLGVPVQAESGIAMGRNDPSYPVIIRCLDGNDAVVIEDQGAMHSGVRVEGGRGDDRLKGSLGNDTLFGGDGNDAITGYAGRDEIRGGAGDDLINGGDGEDYLAGNSGADTIRGGEGDDTLSGNGGRDRLFGNGGSDSLLGGQGNDILNDFGTGGRDYLAGGEGVDIGSLDATDLLSSIEVVSVRKGEGEIRGRS